VRRSAAGPEPRRGTGRFRPRTRLTGDMVVDELRKIGFANMADYMKSTPQGDPYLDFSALTRDQTAALSEVTVEDFLDHRGEDARAVKRVKFKLHDKRAALLDLGRHLGLFETKHKHDVPVEIDISDIRDTILKRLARLPLRHRQTKGAETDMLGLPPLRHTSTLLQPNNRLPRICNARD